MTLTKEGIAPKIAHDRGFMKHEAAEVLETHLAIIKQRLLAGVEALIWGFGKWTAQARQARPEPSNR